MNRYSFFLLPVLLLTLLLSAGCGDKEAPLPDPDLIRQELVGKKWTCNDMFGREIYGDVRPTIEFMADGTVKGDGGCNTFSGPYNLSAEGITFGEMAVTRKMCAGSLGEVEDSFLNLLRSVTRFEVSGNDLELYSDEYEDPMDFSAGGGGLFW